MKHYVYQHIRKDTQEVFYIGIGTKSTRNYTTFKSMYYRANTLKGRNAIWKHIVKKTPYRVEILFESDDYNKIKEKEKELISFFGKKTISGCLSNISDGGEGAPGVIKPKGEESQFSKAVYQYDLEGNFIKKWGCAQEVERELGYYANSICDCCNNPYHKTAYKHQWKYFYKEKIDSVIPGYKKSVLQLTKDNLIINEWSSAKEAGEKLGLNFHSIRDCCLGRLKTYKKFVWQYKT